MGIRMAYHAQKAVVKLAVKVVKIMADWRWGRRLVNDHEGNKICFGKRHSVL